MATGGIARTFAQDLAHVPDAIPRRGRVALAAEGRRVRRRVRRAQPARVLRRRWPPTRRSMRSTSRRRTRSTTRRRCSRCAAARPCCARSRSRCRSPSRARWSTQARSSGTSARRGDVDALPADDGASARDPRCRHARRDRLRDRRARAVVRRGRVAPAVRPVARRWRPAGPRHLSDLVRAHGARGTGADHRRQRPCVHRRRQDDVRRSCSTTAAHMPSSRPHSPRRRTTRPRSTAPRRGSSSTAGSTPRPRSASPHTTGRCSRATSRPPVAAGWSTRRSRSAGAWTRD